MWDDLLKECRRNLTVFPAKTCNTVIIIRCFTTSAICFPILKLCNKRWLKRMLSYQSRHTGFQGGYIFFVELWWLDKCFILISLKLTLLNSTSTIIIYIRIRITERKTQNDYRSNQFLKFYYTTHLFENHDKLRNSAFRWVSKYKISNSLDPKNIAHPLN